MNEENKPKEIILGFPGAGARNVASTLGGMSERSRKAVSEVMSSRRNKLTLLIPHFVETNYLKSYTELSNKEFKKKSKEFQLIYRYVESLTLHLYSKGTILPAEAKLKQMVKLINSLTNTPQFAKMDFEDVSTDYFELTFATFIALKNVANILAKRGINTVISQQVIMVASDLGLRLYDMYIDKRKDDVNEEETVQFR